MTKKSTDKHATIREDEVKYFKRGEYLYRKLRTGLEKKYIGKVIAIDPDSGKYVIGEDELDTARKAQKEFPGKPLDYFRVGEEVMHKFRKNRDDNR